MYGICFTTQIHSNCRKKKSEDAWWLISAATRSVHSADPRGGWACVRESIVRLHLPCDEGRQKREGQRQRRRQRSSGWKRKGQRGVWDPREEDRRGTRGGGTVMWLASIYRGTHFHRALWLLSWKRQEPSGQPVHLKHQLDRTLRRTAPSQARRNPVENKRSPPSLSLRILWYRTSESC